MRRAGPPVARASAGLVMLHGRGGSAADILSLLDHAGLQNVAAIAPEAPGHSWWPTSFLAPAADMAPYVDQGLAAVDAALSELEEEGLSRDRLWLLGFSQGACLALEAFARKGDGLAGVFGFSGGLVGLGDSGARSAALHGYADKSFYYEGRRGGRAWLSVHAQDPHIPLARVERSASVLQEMGAAVQLVIHPGTGHGILAADMAALRGALNG
jgi:phospholipase/carboxylesterase